jgi:ubiquinone/menaquinone biosynthesis C-methylase UbiE
MNGPRLLTFNQPHLKKRVLSATDLDFPDESFDFILAHQVLEHINRYPEVLDHLARLCRKGGILYISVRLPELDGVLNDISENDMAHFRA